MIATSHVIIGGTVGVLVGTATQNPLAALAAGFVSHLICDLIPHLDHPPAPKIGDDLVFTRAVYIFAIADSVIAFLFTLLVWNLKFDFPALTPYAMGALGGYLPDFLDNVPLWRFKVRTLWGFRQFHTLHLAVHHTWMNRFPMPEYWLLGTVSQIVFVVPCLWFLFTR
jgi:hypothetical protein